MIRAACYGGQTITVKWPHLASALDIEQWADSLEARGEVPRLIRRLIRQTSDQVIVLDMGAGEAIDAPGYDGRVEAQRGTPLVPEGKSVWEIGTGRDPRRKADEDYKERSTDPLGANRTETTFVFVTCRRWSGKRDWEDGKRKEGPWRDVRAFDVQDIETALESAPAVHIWLSEILGKPVAGVETIEEWWTRFANSMMPVLSPELVLVGRADHASAFLRFLEQEPHVITISAASQDDVIAFVAAVLLTSPEDGRADLLARALVVRDAYSLRQLDKVADLLILVPFEDDLRREALLVRSHHVILLAEEGTPADVSLPAIAIEPSMTLLKDLHVEEERATRLARAANRSLIAYQRESPARPGIALRDWAQYFTSKVVRRAWLAGGWTEQRSGDLDAMTAFVSLPYEDAREELVRVARGPDPLLTVTGQQWGRILPEAALPYAQPSISGTDLEVLERAIQSVLGAVDPALELPVAERWKASLHGKTRIHSSALRDGLATTLALLGSRGNSIALGNGRTAQDWSELAVFGIFRRANEDPSGQLWASLSDVLPLLAESAPDVFLRAVKDGTTGNYPVLKKMFLDHVDRSSISVSSPHTGLLWALEGVAWSSEHLSLAAELLARLAEIDPGGRLSNRPKASLASIFRTWLPQTSASADARLRIIDGICSKHSEVGWELLFDLLPENHAIGHHTHSPKFQPWKPAKQDFNDQEHRDLSSAVTQRAIELAGRNASRWVTLITRLSDFPPQDRRIAFERLSAVAGDGELSEGQREQIWDAIDGVVRRHRSFSDAEWAMRADDLDRLNEIGEKFKPKDPVASTRWLFRSLPELAEGKRSGLPDYDARLKELRETSVRIIWAAEGMGGLIRTAESCEASWAVGHAAATSGVELDEMAFLDLLDSSDPKKAGLALGFTGARVASAGWAWVERALGKLAERPIAQARVLRISDDLAKVWEKAEQLGEEVQKAYWKEFSPYGRGKDFALINEVAEQLIAHGRVAVAVDFLAMYTHGGGVEVDPALAARALEALVGLETTDAEVVRLSNYNIETLLTYVRPRIEEDRAALLEWRLLPALGPFAASPILHRRLAKDPAFFIQILSFCVQPKTREEERNVPPAVASNAWHLLQEWKIVPGSKAVDGEVDETELDAWLKQARDLAKEADRWEIADVYIGQVFAHARTDEDNSWPTLPVRNAIERTGSPELEDGFKTGTYNKRGATVRDLTEGGRQERALATKYREYASKVQDGWPRTAAVLRNLADGYESEARMHDEEAQRFLKGMDR